MTLALRLRQAGADVTLYETAPSPGGLAHAQEIGGFTWDRFYHVILLSDRHLLGLLQDLGLGERLRWETTRTGFFVDGRLHSLSNSLEFLTFPPLNLLDKIRLGTTILRASKIKNWQALEKVFVTDWLKKWSGGRTFERIWLPLLKSKLGDNYQIASAAFIWAIIARMYAARRSGLKREMFGYVEGGYARVLAGFEARLQEEGIDLRFATPIEEIRQEPDGVVLRTRSGLRFHHDEVVITLPTTRIPGLVPQLAPPEVEQFKTVVYQGVACLSLLLRRPLGGYYVTNITDDWVPFTGVIEMTALVDPATFGGYHLVYLPRYLTQDDPFWRCEDDEIEETFVQALERMYPGFTRADVVDARVARAREVQAISTLQYSTTLKPSLETSLPNVFVANSSQIAAGTLNLNETIGLAEAQATALVQHLGRATRNRRPAPAKEVYDA